MILPGLTPESMRSSSGTEENRELINTLISYSEVHDAMAQSHQRSFGPSWATLRQDSTRDVQCPGIDHEWFAPSR